jgi:hypothetical protein
VENQDDLHAAGMVQHQDSSLRSERQIQSRPE